jgi:phage-related protein (TIGR01555 family)
MIEWLRTLLGGRQAAPAPVVRRELGSFWTTHAAPQPGVRAADVLDRIMRTRPVAEGAQDGAEDTLKLRGGSYSNLSEPLAMWYASQGFIGHQMAAVVAQHWLVAKACGMPGRDAIRQGWDAVTVDGDALPPEAVKLLKRADRQMRLRWNLEQFIHMGRVFGVRVALFRVESEDPDYYEKPFNPDGVKQGTYRGITQVDPYWMAPMLNQEASSNPASPTFYEPTWWQINGKRYHRSHLVIFRNDDLPDVLKPSYQYGGVPLPQKILERVYAAERVANEAPQLAQTKRTTVWQTDMAAFAAKGADAVAKLMEWVGFRDNYGVKLGDKDGDVFQQFDTSLADLDATIMTQYQLVAAIADVPATKLMGTSPKGFGASGEYEESSYREFLESLQTHDLTPLIERHYLLVMRSSVAPTLGIEPVDVAVNWRPLDSPTAKEVAETNLIKAQVGAALVGSGAIASEDERQRVATDPSSGYPSLGARPESEDPEDRDDEDAAAAGNA